MVIRYQTTSADGTTFLPTWKYTMTDVSQRLGDETWTDYETRIASLLTEDTNDIQKRLIDEERHGYGRQNEIKKKDKDAYHNGTAEHVPCDPRMVQKGFASAQSRGDTLLSQSRDGMILPSILFTSPMLRAIEYACHSASISSASKVVTVLNGLRPKMELYASGPTQSFSKTRTEMLKRFGIDLRYGPDRSTTKFPDNDDYYEASKYAIAGVKEKGELVDARLYDVFDTFFELTKASRRGGLTTHSGILLDMASICSVPKNEQKKMDHGEWRRYLVTRTRNESSVT